jgi:hypothetical protein
MPPPPPPSAHHHLPQDEKKDQLEAHATKSLRAHARDAYGDDTAGGREDGLHNSSDDGDDGHGGDGGDDDGAWLVVELPQFRIPIIAAERPYVRKTYALRLLGRGGQEWFEQVDANTGKTYYHNVRDEKQTWRRPEPPTNNTNQVGGSAGGAGAGAGPSDLNLGEGWQPLLSRYIDDPETERDNPCLQKTLKLFRSGNAAGQNTKPNKDEAATIEKILKSSILKNTLPPLHASLLWQFRHALCSRACAWSRSGVLASWPLGGRRSGRRG